MWLTECRHQPATQLPEHSHTRAALTLVVDGEFLEVIEGKPHQCGPMSVLFKPADAPHWNQYSSRGAHSFIVELSPELVASCQPFADFRRFVMADRRGGQGVPAALALRLYGSFRSGSSALQVETEELLTELLANAAFRYRRPRGPVPRWLRCVRDRVHDGYRTPLSLGSLANEAGVHPVYLARAFRARFGCSVGTYLHARRLDAAIEALVAGDRSISAISSELGFHDHSHFNRLFRRVIGVAPSVLRRLAATARTAASTQTSSDRTSAAGWAALRSVSRSSR